jgi:outer membrane protein assembly factor BamB
MLTRILIMLIVIVGLAAMSSFAGSGPAYENGFLRDYLLALRPDDGAQYWQTAVSLIGSLVVGAP